MPTCLKHQIQKNEWEYRFLETDGFGGFVSFPVTNGNVRYDDSLFTYSYKAPIKRYKLVQKFDERIVVDGQKFNLSSATFANDKRNTTAKNNFLSFTNDLIPTWTFQCIDVTIKKQLVYANDTRQVAIVYSINNPFGRELCYEICPQLAGHQLGHYKQADAFDYQVSMTNDCISFTSETAKSVFIKSSLPFTPSSEAIITDYFYAHDARDGRDALGSSASYGSFTYQTKAKQGSFEFVLSSENNFVKTANELIDLETVRKQQIIDNCNGTSDFSKELALATDNYLVNRESTGHKTIIAGYPFFGDWGRDTFWALNGVCIQTNRLAEAKSILKSFIKYEQNGLLPNMFPEGDEDPFYNSVDAPLLFINSLYEYYQASDDQAFITEATPIIESIINNYIAGTDYHIYMDEDGLIAGGAELEQLTWMDVRFDTILPTPRQGKCVEINAMWYNCLKIVEYFQANLALEFTINANLNKLIEQVGNSFKAQFITEAGGLLDVISNTSQDRQIRSNQIWALTQNFTPLSEVEAQAVIKHVSKHLFAGYGIRTLSPNDPDFKHHYGDSHFERDMAYHQGTVWPFILGGYIRAYLKSEGYSDQAKDYARDLLESSKQALSEYCLGQICEVMDGLHPSNSKGCYAQAWSISEIYRALCEVERN
ncbi:amylo-alpha-1,6-glucosidase [Mollicutes bacterium LVI A0039]|nr:amylo-alpha-1,6-glucosidase [Mollicutes bacterium LVI A0039]